MSVFSRFKRNPEGFRQLIELWETTPASRRQKMIEIGMTEDADYAKRALELMISFEDILSLPDLELAEVFSEASAIAIGYAIYPCDSGVRTRVLSRLLPPLATEVKETLQQASVTSAQTEAGRIKVIESARKLEKQLIIKLKRIK